MPVQRRIRHAVRGFGLGLVLKMSGRCLEEKTCHPRSKKRILFFLFRSGPMLISYFSNIKQTLPERQEKSWSEFASYLEGCSSIRYMRKIDVPAFSPAEYPPGTHRLKSKVVAVHFGVLDLDKLDDDQMAVVNEKLKGHAHIFYTTWSHAESVPLWCARLVIPFSRPVLAGEWDVFWPRMNAMFGGFGDPACKDPSRVYFVPATHADAVDDFIFHHSEKE